MEAKDLPRDKIHTDVSTKIYTCADHIQKGVENSFVCAVTLNTAKIENSFRDRRIWLAQIDRALLTSLNCLCKLEPKARKTVYDKEISHGHPFFNLSEIWLAHSFDVMEFGQWVM